MKITTDKLYYNGKEFIVNNWPELPNNYNPDGLEREYKAALTRAIEEGYGLKDVDDKILLLWMNDRGVDPISESDRRRILREGFLTLPEPREFEIAFHVNASDLNDPEDWHYLTNPRINRMTAVLLPKKEEIKPAPLGESSKELKRVPKLVKWAKDGYPPIDLNGQYRHVVELIWHYIDMEKKSTSPTSEAPEEQEELWSAVFEELMINETNFNTQLDKKHLMSKYSIHRKKRLNP